MQIAFIPPRQLLGTASGHSNYHLILAPQVLEDLEYRRHYWQVPGFKILDNGIAEGIELSQDEILHAAKLVGAHELVVPDVLGDSIGTLEKLRRWRFVDGLSHMAVVQGESIEECMDVIEGFNVVSAITALGIPRILGRTISRDARLILMGEILQRFAGRFYIHFLGAHEWVDEVRFAETAYPNCIRGMDTSMPFVHAYFKNLVVEEGSYYPRPDGYFDLEFNDEQLLYADHNMHTMLEWAS